MARRNDSSDAKIYVGGLPADATSDELDEAFHRFGRIRKIWIARRPPGFAFVEFDDPRDAEDAVKSMDGGRICGVRARVQFSHGGRKNAGGGGGRGRSRERNNGYDRRRSRSRERERRRSPSRSRTRSPRRERASPKYSRSRSPTHSPH